VKNRIIYESKYIIIVKPEKNLTTHKNFCFNGRKPKKWTDQKICRFVLKVIDLNGITRKWKEQKKKISENIYIMSVLTDYLV
jgi:hypothetical protein